MKTSKEEPIEVDSLDFLPCKFCSHYAQHHSSCEIMRHIPKPWMGPEWCRVLCVRKLDNSQTAWICVYEDGAEMLFQFANNESLAIQATRLGVWPLTPYREKK